MTPNKLWKIFKYLRKLPVIGVLMEMGVKDIAGHIMLTHHIYALDVENEERFGKVIGMMYIPQSEIKAKRPFYMIIRRCRRSFLFCMEHATDNSDFVGFWIRRMSNMENKEDDNGPCFKYNLLIVNGNMKVAYRNGCIPWRKSIDEIFVDKNCLKLPISLILDELVLTCVDGICNNENEETGYLLVNFEINIGNAVGELYWDDAAEMVTSSMESLTTAVDCTDQRHNNETEIVQESVNDVDDDAQEENEEEAVNVNDDDIDDDDGKRKQDEENAVSVDEDVEDYEEKKDEEGEPQSVVSSAIEENPNEMKTWFERLYSNGESPKYTP